MQTPLLCFCSQLLPSTLLNTASNNHATVTPELPQASHPIGFKLHLQQSLRTQENVNKLSARIYLNAARQSSQSVLIQLDRSVCIHARFGSELPLDLPMKSAYSLVGIV